MPSPAIQTKLDQLQITRFIWCNCKSTRLLPDPHPDSCPYKGIAKLEFEEIKEANIEPERQV